MPTRKLPVWLTDPEVDALLAQITTRSITGLRNRAMIAAMLGAGLRVSEVVGLRGSDVDLTEGTVAVRDGKGGRDRTVPVDGETLGWLRAWGEKRRALGLDGRAPFFPRVRTKGLGGRSLGQHGPLAIRTVQLLVNRLMQQAGLNKGRCGPHVLRHTFATRMLRRGFTLAEVRDLLGHADIRTTSIYLHADPQDLRRKMKGERQTEAQQVAEALLAKLPEDVREALAAVLAGGGDARRG